MADLERYRIDGTTVASLAEFQDELEQYLLCFNEVGSIRLWKGSPQTHERILSTNDGTHTGMTEEGVMSLHGGFLRKLQ